MAVCTRDREIFSWFRTWRAQLSSISFLHYGSIPKFSNVLVVHFQRFNVTRHIWRACNVSNQTMQFACHQVHHCIARETEYLMALYLHWLYLRALFWEIAKISFYWSSTVLFFHIRANLFHAIRWKPLSVILRFRQFNLRFFNVRIHKLLFTIILDLHPLLLLASENWTELHRNKYPFTLAYGLWNIAYFAQGSCYELFRFVFFFCGERKERHQKDERVFHKRCKLGFGRSSFVSVFCFYKVCSTQSALHSFCYQL